MADLPDMSHLTPEERRIIEGVMMRQKQEEQRENEIMRRKQDEVQVLEETIRARSEQHKKSGIELDATCQICSKTKFADGVGHICNYCNIRCCARCGGKVTLRSNKVIWVCIVCRKKQEIFLKTGQWMNKSGLNAADTAMLRRMQEDMQGPGIPGHPELTQDKRPKLERAHSAAEKENLPLVQRGACTLIRQYSQQDQVSGRRMSTSDSGVEMSVSPHSRSLPTPHVVVGSYPQTPRHPAAYPEDDPSLYRGELDNLMRQHAQTYQRPVYQDSDIPMTYGHAGVENVPRAMHGSQQQQQQHSIHGGGQVGHPSQSLGPPGSGGGGGQNVLHQQRSFSSSEEERSTPDCASDEPDESEKGKGYFHHGGGPASMSGGSRRHGSHNGHHVTGAMTIEYNGHHPPREPRKEESTLVRRSFRRSGDEWRADSRRFTERRGKKTVRFDGGTNVGGNDGGSHEDWSWEADRQGSQDSATKDSGIDTSSTFTSSEDSNRGDLPKQPLSWQGSSDGQKIIGHMILRKSSGSGSSSSILGLKVVGGKLLENGSRGALIEKVKKGSTADVEGQLRPGDEVLQWNGRSLQGKSFQEVNDIIMKSREEPQVELIVSRNLSGTSTAAMLTGVQTTVPASAIGTPRRITVQTQWRQKHEPMPIPQQPHHKDYMIFRIPGLKKCILWELYDAKRDKPSVLVTSPGSPDLHAQGRGRHLRNPPSNANVGGTLQVKLGFDPVALQLIVILVCAAALTPRSNGQPRNPYAKIFLLPDKSEKSKRRTKTLANTNDPKWNQSFIYNMRRSELRHRSVEITVWDLVKYGANDFLGEVIIDLATSSLNEKPEWHYLLAHEEQRHAGYYTDPIDDIVITPVDCHLSPPSTTSRLSDSDTSECDITDCDVSREQRRTADGASLSSRGSSSRFHNMPSNYKRHYSSPPPERDLCMDNEHRSRRDMSPQGRKRAALMITRDQPVSIAGYQSYRKEDSPRGMMGHRSHSAAPMDSPNIRYRGRSQSPTGHRSLSPPEHRSIPYPHGYMPPRFGSRSATATPTGSPKKRQLPQIPANLHAALKERVTQDLEERARFMRHRNRQVHTTYRSTGMGGWERHYSGLSDSDLPSMGQDPLSLSHTTYVHRMHRSRRGHLSPDKDVLGDLGDSDMESNASVTSSVFSTQSERPRGSRALIPTVKNVLIPGVISPMPPPPRRNRRRHRIRVPCSECHCPTSAKSNNNKSSSSSIIINSTKSRSNQTVKHNPTHHPLVRSKSAVVRSLYRKMRTPFTRSQTVDENLLRYYSPETSEYTVSEGYILKPEKLVGKTKNRRIPEIYVEDCLQVNFADGLLDKFRNSSAGRSNHAALPAPFYNAYETMRKSTNRSAAPTTASLSRRLPSGWKEPLENSIVSRSKPFGTVNPSSLTTYPADYELKNLITRSSTIPRRSLLSSKARSFDYSVISNDDPAFSSGSLRGDAAPGSFLSRRAKSFEYETVSSNIFSDDSLRTARRKFKQNLSISDSKYGDKIPALRDRSKSYYDSNGDNELRKTLAANALVRYTDFEDPQAQEKFYSSHLDSHLGPARMDYFDSLDTRVPPLAHERPSSVLAREDIGKRKYVDSSYRSPDKRTKSLENEVYGNREINDHVYCSIDEIILPEDPCPCRLVSSSRSTTLDLLDRNDYAARRHVKPRRRAKSTDSYLEDEYENWELAPGYEFEYPPLDDSRIPILDVEGYYEEEKSLKKPRSSRIQGEILRDRIIDGYDSYNEPVQFYADESLSYRDDQEDVIGSESYEDSSQAARRRRRRRFRDNVIVDEATEADIEYENFPINHKNTLTVPSLSQSKKMMIGRAESTPILPHDEDYALAEERMTRRMSRRRRNSSCPESRELVVNGSCNSTEVRAEEEPCGFFIDSDEEFGSMETVIGPNYGDSTARKETRISSDSRPRYEEAVENATREEVPVESYRAMRSERSESFSGTTRRYREEDDDDDFSSGYQYRRRKSSCPECRELANLSLDAKSSILSSSRRDQDYPEDAYKYRRRRRRRNSSCPEAREMELYEEERRPANNINQQQQQQQQPPQQQQGSKRNVAISDTLEYYEYSMESESQCSENCGFGPYDSLRPRNRAAPRPGNANSNIFDSQKTATSDTAKNPRATDDDHHHAHHHRDHQRYRHENQRDYTKQRNDAYDRYNDNDRDRNHNDENPSSASTKNVDETDNKRDVDQPQRRSSQRKKINDNDDQTNIRDTAKHNDLNERRSSSMPESSEYASQGSSYEKNSRHIPAGNGHNGHTKRGQFTRSLSNADVPPDEKVDGSLSDTAVGLHPEDNARRGRKSSPSSKSGSGSSSGGGSASQYQTGLGKKSNSTSQLSATVGRQAEEWPGRAVS
ncbi:uncharacterized protein Rim isoform X2 [Venturia canescens]|uniref:uncharacterized protein Rim isoform X2 n=1 Tax=Venturia canescens TaxID=32260 RepID=UPI001C9D369A|nr:uncharacterized protein LOC122415887 isoform X2 [Venturia canescens]